MTTAKKFMRQAICMIVLMVGSGLAIAQDPGLPGGPDYDPDTEVPLDGGAGVLLAAGVIYGVRKLRRKRRKLS